MNIFVNFTLSFFFMKEVILEKSVQNGVSDGMVFWQYQTTHFRRFRLGQLTLSFRFQESVSFTHKLVQIDQETHIVSTRCYQRGKRVFVRVEVEYNQVTYYGVPEVQKEVGLREYVFWFWGFVKQVSEELYFCSFPFGNKELYFVSNIKHFRVHKSRSGS